MVSSESVAAIGITVIIGTIIIIIDTASTIATAAALLPAGFVLLQNNKESFRDGPKDQTSDVQLHIGESQAPGSPALLAPRNDNLFWFARWSQFFSR
jgi:hypothetical protein